MRARRYCYGVVRRFISLSNGNMSVLMALTMPMFVGAAGLGFEVSNWLMTQRAMQNAADAAAMAASTNGGLFYAAEAKAVAAQYGYTSGTNGISVTASNAAACPAGGNNCYSVTITGAVPLYLSPVVGYTGDTTVNGQKEKTITATAIATQVTTPRQYCILALASSGVEGIRTNGNPKANLAGCNTMSNTTSTCNGHNLNADYGDAHGTNNGCGNVETSNVPVVVDPYSGLAANIPADPCVGSYPQEPAKKNGSPLPASNQWSGTKSWSGNKVICGELQLTGNTTINSLSGVLVIENGQLDTNGYTLQTSVGSAVTVVFSGSNGAYTHAPTGGGTLDLTAPTSGKWSGTALYQDPKLTSGVDISAAGNSPTWDITGLVYLPHSSVTFSGAVNKSSNGQSCFAIVVDNITINGTGSILDHGGCAAAGLSMPTGNVPTRGQLVG